jgi:predicted YcjX-like family ATPase
MTIKEASILLGLAPWTVARKACKSELEATKNTRGQWEISTRAVDDYISRIKFQRGNSLYRARCRREGRAA